MRIVCTGNMSPICEKSVVCLGYFDGVHLGHQALLHAARDIADKEGLLMCVHTFDRSPFQALHPDRQVVMLTDENEKEELLASFGCDVMAVSPFDEEMRKMSGKQFFEEILLRTLNASCVVAGDDHRFGFMGETDVTALAALCVEHHVALKVVPRITLQSGQVISSTTIRSALQAGNLALAEEMLGRPVDSNMILRCGMRQER